MLTKVAYILDLVLLAFAFGATVWFFFVQTPVLLRWKGKERFIPIQMRLTRSLFSTLAVVLPVMFGLTLIHGHEALWLHIATAGLAMLAALANAFVVVPRALRAGGKSMKEVRESGDPGTLTDFASRGAGEPAKALHRLVVLLVVVMLGGLAAHGAVLLDHSPSTPHHAVVHASHDHDHGHNHAHAAPDDEPSPPMATRWPADPKTTEHVHAMSALVAESNGAADDPTPGLRQRYQQIFRDCTMTGDAHNALHDFLVPVGEQLDALESASASDRAPLLEKLHAHLSMYDQKFE